MGRRKPNPSTGFIVAGVHLGGPGYPNAERTVMALRETGEVEIRECGYWLPDDFRLWQIVRAPPLKRLALIARIVLGNLWSGLRSLIVVWRTGQPVYVPYPAVPLLWLLSWIPSKVRPVLIADAFISLWDSLVIDRGGARSGRNVVRWLWRLERRALRSADHVLTDTTANATYLVSCFNLDPARVRAIPLAVIEPELSNNGKPSINRPQRPFRVVYVGTLVPLHGIARLLRGIEPLLEDARFEFLIVGDGQDAPIVETFCAVHPGARLRWVREWQSPAEMNALLDSAHVCLGVFGGDGKAARVLPFKLYLYLAHGRAVVTQSDMSLPMGLPSAPVVGIDWERPEQISSALLALVSEPARLKKLECEARTYFDSYLSNARVFDAWRELLSELSEERQK